MRHIVALSGGKDSTAMALRLMEKEGDRGYEFAITPTGRELPEMEAHWAKLEKLLGRQLIRVPGPSLLDRIKAYKAVPNFRMRWCTREVKIEPFIQYVREAVPATCYVGIRADEAEDREGTSWHGIEGVRQDLPLVRWGWNLKMVQEYLAYHGVEVPERTDCDLCYHQRLIEWWRLWKNHPDRYQEAVALETWTGHTLRSEQRDTWPASLAEMRVRFEAGQIPRERKAAKRATMCAWCAR